MNQALTDLSLLVLSIAAAILYIRRTDKREVKPLFAFFLLFPQYLFFANMLGHTVAVLVVNLTRIEAGTFQYSFHVYSLFLFGIVFMALSVRNIQMARKRIAGDVGQRKAILKGNALTALFFFPIIFLNPIGTLPILAALISSITLWVGGSSRQGVVYTPAKQAAGLREVAI